ncbi:glyoxalase/bleomycin resistance protein/dioxygenase [Bisporella sp. PMI_857]|nr:glyoxalase/bleomycin resistance protein/dioxygenase [Bisporella sp. PMI_857]
MTINHFNLLVSQAKMPVMRTFYKNILKPLGYTEMIHVNDNYVGFGTDYPYLWLKALPVESAVIPTHVAFDATDFAAVDEFFKLAIDAGAQDNGKPGIRPEMSRQPYYSAFVIDPDGNNIEAVFVDKKGKKSNR